MMNDDLMMIFGSLWDHFGMTLGSFWGYSGTILESFWYHFGINRGNFGVILESFGLHSGIIFESFGDHSDLILGLFWSYLEVIWGSFQDHFLEFGPRAETQITQTPWEQKPMLKLICPTMVSDFEGFRCGFFLFPLHLGHYVELFYIILLIL